MKIDNPFFYNYVFSEEDLNRCAIKKWEYPFLFFLPTHVACSDGYAWFYKRWGGEIYLVKYEELLDEQSEKEKHEKTA